MPRGQTIAVEIEKVGEMFVRRNILRKNVRCEIYLMWKMSGGKIDDLDIFDERCV